MSEFYLGGAKEGKQALFSRQEWSPCGLWISCSNNEGKKNEHSHSAFYLGRNKKKKYNKYKTHNTQTSAVIK